MIASVDKLRDCTWIGSSKVNEYLDEIEREIAECYLALPLDADGVPIHVGDVLECHANGYHGIFTVFAVSHCVVVGDHDIEWITDNPTKWFHFAYACRHVKARTLEDVLEEYYDKRGWDEADNCALNADELTAKYADEIRELLGGDAQ